MPRRSFRSPKSAAQAQNSHYLTGDSDLKTVFTGDTVNLSAQSYIDKAQCPVIHIQAAFEQNPPLIDAKQIALLQMVVDHGAQQIVRRSNGMHIVR